jgi:hypothetical protein
MKNLIKCLLLSIIAVVFSCSQDKDASSSLKVPKALQWSSKFEVFDEPNQRGIEGMKFYVMIISESFLDTLSILSIRQDSTSIQGFYKRIASDQIPASFPNKVETKTFQYSTIRFSLEANQVDSIKQIIKRNDLLSLKDSAKTNATDGKTNEIIIYDGKNFHNLYRGYAFDKDVEPGFVKSVEEIMKFAPR